MHASRSSSRYCARRACGRRRKAAWTAGASNGCSWDVGIRGIATELEEEVGLDGEAVDAGTGAESGMALPFVLVSAPPRPFAFFDAAA